MEEFIKKLLSRKVFFKDRSIIFFEFLAWQHFNYPFQTIINLIARLPMIVLLSQQPLQKIEK